MLDPNITKSFSELPAWHRELLTKLLESPFPGNTELMGQVFASNFSIVDDNQSLKIVCSACTPASVRKTIPVEARALDSDGVPIESLLFTREGLAYLLENRRLDGELIKDMPPVKAFNVTM
jgi:hypothetical protein